MRSWKESSLVLFLFLLSGTICIAQSLPEIAHQQRLKQQARDIKMAKRVITDDDMPHSEASDSTVETDQSDSTGPAHKAGKSAEQWKKDIEAQQSVVASLQQQIDKLNASVHYVQANLYTNGAQYNQYQAKKQEEVSRLQTKLDSEKKKLADMQEAARKEGFGNSVYQPQ
ncbi:MAG TPA: hypothetical protein VH437_00790 [Terriglobales bacterium]|jgi:predicted RNase H-like nuclease (RuvC/YqgF family)